MTIHDNDAQRSGADLFTIVEETDYPAEIKVIGVGGGGGNAVEYMLKSHIDGVQFICANTDAQALKRHNADVNVQLGTSLTRGLGAGAKPEVGRQAAQDDRDRIAESLKGADIVFITAGMGGGTGTGAAPVIAEVAKEMGILTVAVVTKPFHMEGARRMQAAEAGLEELSASVDSLIIIPNQKLLPVLGEKVTLLEAFAAANDVLLNAVKGVAELITTEGMLNVDFADVKTVMTEMGMAMMGIGTAKGDDRAAKAAEDAISSPLLEDVDLTGARGILVNVTHGPDLALSEFDVIGNIVREKAADDAHVIVGTVLDMDMTDEVRVTVVATGLSRAAGTPRVAVDNTRKREAQSEVRRPERMPVAKKAVGGDLSDHASSAPDMDYLDIPAFLRKQAD